MPIRVLDLVNKRKEIVVEWEGEQVKLAYRPYSQVIENAMKEVATKAAAEGAKGIDRGATIEQLKALLLSWELVGEDGKPAPISYETLDILPSPLLIAMNRAIVAAMYPNLTSGASTAAG